MHNSLLARPRPKTDMRRPRKAKVVPDDEWRYATEGEFCKIARQ